MDTSSDPKRTVTDSSSPADKEKVTDEPIHTKPENEEKAIKPPRTLSNPLTPPDKGDNCNQPSLEGDSLQRFAEGFADAPPPLPFCCWDHKLPISIFWFFILAEICFIPESFYYGLTFGTTLNHGALFAIITSVFGFVSGYEYGRRVWLLLLSRDEYRPLFGSRRFWSFDGLHWILTIPYTVLTGILIGGSIPGEPLVRILAMPMAVGNIIMGIMFISSGIAVRRKMKLPFRMSSHTKGSLCPPITYTIIEDVIAVDARAGKVYREALLQRYNASPRFRTMLLQLVWFWGIPSVIVGAALLALIFTVKKEVAYGLGWAVPNIWAGIWTVSTILWVRRSLRTEKETWKTDRASLL